VNRGVTVGRGFSARQWYTLALLALVYTCHIIDRTIVNIVLDPIKKEFRLTDFQLGMFSGLAFAIGTLVASIPLGTLADRYSRKVLLAACIVVWSSLTLTCGLASNYLMLLLSRFGVGMAEAGLQPTALSIVSDEIDRDRRSKAVAIVHVGIPMGTLVGFLAGGLIGQHFGWRVTLFLVGVPGLLLAAVVALTLTEPRREASKATNDERVKTREFIRILGSNRPLLHVVAGVATLWLSTTSSSAWLAPFLMRSHGASIALVGLILAGTVGIGGFAGNLLAGTLSQRLAVGRPDRLAGLACAGALLYFALGLVSLLTGNLALVVAALFLQMACFFLVFTPAYSLAMVIADARIRGRTAAVIAMGATVVGYGIGPQISGELSDLFRTSAGIESLRYAMVVMMTLMLWPATHFYLAKRSLQRSPSSIEMQPLASATQSS